MKPSNMFSVTKEVHKVRVWQALMAYKKSNLFKETESCTKYALQVTWQDKANRQGANIHVQMNTGFGQDIQQSTVAEVTL